MKKIISVLVIAMMISAAGVAQKLTPGKVPKEIRKAFTKEFPKGAGASWSLDEGNYEVNFLVNQVKNSATFDKDGKWLEKEATLKEKELPKPVKTTLKKEFKGFKLNTVEQVETPDKGIQYHIVITKGGESFDLQLSPTGDVLNKETREIKKEEKKKK